MPNIATVLKSEITRLARKEIKAELVATKKVSTRHRREIAELKRQLRDQAKKIAALERIGATGGPAKATAPDADATPVRFSPKWVPDPNPKANSPSSGRIRLGGVRKHELYVRRRGGSGVRGGLELQYSACSRGP